MRRYTHDEVLCLPDEVEKEYLDEGYVFIETTIGELASLGVGTACGLIGNQCFAILAEKGYGRRKVKAFFDEKDPKKLDGMVHIKIRTEKTAERVSRIASEAEGSLRFSGESCFEGYMVFEIE